VYNHPAVSKSEVAGYSYPIIFTSISSGPVYPFKADLRPTNIFTVRCYASVVYAIVVMSISVTSRIVPFKCFLCTAVQQLRK